MSVVKPDYTDMARRFRAVAIDLDGTALAPDASFSSQTLRTFKKCQDLGIPVLIVTGRSTETAEKFSQALDGKGPMVFYNGAVIAQMPDAKVLESNPVPTEVIAACVDIARQENLYFQAYLTDNSLVYSADLPQKKVYVDHTDFRGKLISFSELGSITKDSHFEFIKCMFIAEPEQLEPVQAKIEALFGARIYVTKSHAAFLEIMNNGVSKGKSLVRALALRGISVADCVAFGDMENDIPMLEAAGRGVAVENASAAVKAAADDIALSNQADGVALYLEKMLALRT